MERSGIVTLTTDFGPADTYVGVMKGVMLGIAPHLHLVDITHQVQPQAILEGAFLLADAWRYFPSGTVHLAVVDPGVGTGRALIALETPQAWFVAPDNGLLTCVWEGLDESARAAARIVELTERRYWRPEVSMGRASVAPTFHGRDILAPAAAHLAAGVPLSRLGRPRGEIFRLAGTRPVALADGRLHGQVVHVDRFGNCISNITAEQVRAAAGDGLVQIDIADHTLVGLVHTYAEGEVGQPVALIGSAGRLEVAVREGSAARQLGVQTGTSVYVQRAAAGELPTAAG